MAFEFVEVPAPGRGVRLALHPVTLDAFCAFLDASGRPRSPRLRRGRSGSAPVVEVSQEDASAYCRWLGEREVRSYRLPGTAELQTLMEGADGEEIDAGVWPQERGRMPELRGGLKPHFLCEWTCETLEMPPSGTRPPKALAILFYPPWLREGSNVAHVHASVSASEGYSFVTFRVACDG